jgi:hypothetical protein
MSTCGTSLAANHAKQQMLSPSAPPPDCNPIAAQHARTGRDQLGLVGMNGRRFRSWWAKARGGSSPFARTVCLTWVPGCAAPALNVIDPANCDPTDADSLVACDWIS